MEHEKAAEALGGKRKKGKLHTHHVEIHRGKTAEGKAHGHIMIHHMRHADGSMPDNPEEATQTTPVQPGGLQDAVAQSGIDQEPDGDEQAQQPAAGAQA